MPIVHEVKSARKNDKSIGLKKGMPYYWWRFRDGIKRKSLTRPKASQLTQSEFLSSMHANQEAFELIKDSITEDEKDDIASQLDSMADEIDSLGQEQDEKRNNMPEQLQDSEVGQLLETRTEECETISEALREAAENVRNAECEEEEVDEDDDEADDAETTCDISDALGGVDWSFS